MQEDDVISDSAPLIADEFVEYASIDTDEYQVVTDTSLIINNENLDENTIAATQKISVLIAAGEMDILTSDETTFLTYATPDTMHDLRDVYTEEELEKYKDYIYYVDMEVIRQKQAFYNSSDASDIANFKEAVYDHFDPESMTEPIPIAFCIEKSPKINEYFYVIDEVLPMGIIVNTKHFETTKLFVEYLFEGLIP